MVDDSLLLAGAVLGAEAVGVTDFAGGDGGEDDQTPVIGGGDVPPGLSRALGQIQGRLGSLPGPGAGGGPGTGTPDANIPTGAGTDATQAVATSARTAAEAARQRAREAEGRADRAVERAEDFRTFTLGGGDGGLFSGGSSIIDFLGGDDGAGDDRSGGDGEGSGRSTVPAGGRREYDLRYDYSGPGSEVVAGAAEVGAEAGAFGRENPLSTFGTAAGVAAAPFTAGGSLALVGGGFAGDAVIEDGQYSGLDPLNLGSDAGPLYQGPDPLGLGGGNDPDAGGDNGADGSAGGTEPEDAGPSLPSVPSAGDVIPGAEDRPGPLNFGPSGTGDVSLGGFGGGDSGGLGDTGSTPGGSGSSGLGSDTASGALSGSSDTARDAAETGSGVESDSGGLDSATESSGGITGDRDDRDTTFGGGSVGTTAGESSFTGLTG